MKKRAIKGPRERVPTSRYYPGLSEGDDPREPDFYSRVEEPPPDNGWSDVGDSPNEVDPPFDAFGLLPDTLDHHELMRRARALDSSVKVLEDVVDDPEVLHSLDVTFKGIWLKHHG